MAVITILSGRTICSVDLIFDRKVDPDGRTSVWRQVFSMFCLHKRLLTVCRPTDSRVKYQVNKFPQGIKPDRISEQATPRKHSSSLFRARSVAS